MYHLHPPVRLLVGMLVGVKEGETEERVLRLLSLSLSLYLRRIPDIDLKFGVTRLLHTFSQRLD